MCCNSASQNWLGKRRVQQLLEIDMEQQQLTATSGFSQVCIRFSTLVSRIIVSCQGLMYIYVVYSFHCIDARGAQVARRFDERLTSNNVNGPG